MGKRVGRLVIKRSIRKTHRSEDGLGGYSAIQVLRGFAEACNVKGSIQAGALLDVLQDAADHGKDPIPYGMALNLWVFQKFVGSFYDARTIAADDADLHEQKSGHVQPFRPEFEVKFKSNLILIGEPQDSDTKISLAEHDEKWTLWMQCDESRPCIGKLIKRAKAFMEGLGEDTHLRVWYPEGLNYELDDHELRSIVDIQGTARHYRLAD